MIDSTLKNANILIVDDQQPNIDVLEGYLEMEGYQNIKSTTDPRQVLTLWADFEPDILLLDLTMPHLSGYEVMGQLKKLTDEGVFFPIVVLTADSTSEAKQRSLASGAVDFLVKPFDLVEVGLRIRNLLYTSYLQQRLLKKNLSLEIEVLKRTEELRSYTSELKVAKEKAEKSNELKTAFINTISHEIRTPLNGILGFGQIMADPNLTKEEREEYTEMLQVSSQRLIDTVTKFIDISMLTSGNTEVNKVRFNVSTKVNEIVTGYQTEAKRKNLELNTDFSDTTALNCCVTDPQLLEKILTQLIENAIKFTNVGKVVVGLRAMNTDLLVSVSDTGIGIADEHKELVFQYFTQEIMSNNRPYDGTGLGLNIANRLVELLGGKIWLESQKDKGTQVSFLLPEALCATEQPKKSASEEAVYIAKTVLIAEDDDINFSYLNILLKSDKVVTLRAKNGLEAVEKVRNHPEIFLVLMDLKMPEMSGFDATRNIKAIRPELPVLAVTAYSANNDIQAAREAGCVDYIVKPIRKELLIRKLMEFGVQV